MLGAWGLLGLQLAIAGGLAGVTLATLAVPDQRFDGPWWAGLIWIGAVVLATGVWLGGAFPHWGRGWAPRVRLSALWAVIVLTPLLLDFARQMWHLLPANEPATRLSSVQDLAIQREHLRRLLAQGLFRDAGFLLGLVGLALLVSPLGAAGRYGWRVLNRMHIRRRRRAARRVRMDR